MRCLPSLTLSLKAHLLGSTTARVALAANTPDPGGKRYALALSSLSNSEAAMYRAYGKGRLAEDQLISRATKLARLGATLNPSVPVHIGMARLLNACHALHPATLPPDTPLATAPGHLMAGTGAVDNAPPAQDEDEGHRSDARTSVTSASSYYPDSSSRGHDSVDGDARSCHSFIWCDSSDTGSVRSRRTWSLASFDSVEGVAPLWGKRPGDEVHSLRR